MWCDPVGRCIDDNDEGSNPTFSMSRLRETADGAIVSVRSGRDESPLSLWASPSAGSGDNSSDQVGGQ